MQMAWKLTFEQVQNSGVGSSEDQYAARVLDFHFGVRGMMLEARVTEREVTVVLAFRGDGTTGTISISSIYGWNSGLGQVPI